MRFASTTVWAIAGGLFQLSGIFAAGAQSKPPSPPTDAIVQDAPIYKMRADFAVPEGPAFKLVGIDETSILRPSSVRELDLSASGFTGDNGSITLPTQFGIEAAPFLLLKGRELTRRQYERSKWLYRTRVSVASRLSKQSRRPTALALGLRGTLLDKADVRLDDTLAMRVLANLREQHRIYDSAATACNPFACPDTSSHEILLSAKERAVIDGLDRALGQIIAQRQEEQWNATAIDFALAAAALSPEVEGSSMRFHAASAWITWARRAGDHGQFLLGGRAASERDSTTDEMRSSAHASSRLYLGTHAYKVFLEAQVGAEKDQKYTPWFFNSGGELRLTNSLWAEFSAGINQTAVEKRGKFVTRFKLHTAVPKAISGP